MKKKKQMTPQEAKAMVDDIVVSFEKTFLEKTKGVRPHARWMVISRAINSIFSRHYAPCIIGSNEILRKAYQRAVFKKGLLKEKKSRKNGLVLKAEKPGGVPSRKK